MLGSFFIYWLLAFTHPFGGDGGGGGGGGFGGGTPYHLNTRAWKLGKQVFACE